MRVLLIFDNTDNAEENLRTALCDARMWERADSKARQLEVQVCVLELRYPDLPLDDYLADMERATTHTKKLVRQILDQERFPTAKIEVLRGVETQINFIVNQVALKQGSERVYLSLAKPCWCCEEAANKISWLGRFFGHKPPKAIPTAACPSVDIKGLLNSLHCPIVVMCHGEKLMALQLHRPKTKPYSQVQRSA